MDYLTETCDDAACQLCDKRARFEWMSSTIFSQEIILSEVWKREKRIMASIHIESSRRAIRLKAMRSVLTRIAEDLFSLTGIWWFHDNNNNVLTILGHTHTHTRRGFGSEPTNRILNGSPSRVVLTVFSK